MHGVLKPYICQYRNGGVIHSCRIEAESAEHAAERMRSLPWGADAGPVGTPRRYHPNLESVVNYAVASLTQLRALMGAEPADTPAEPPVRRWSQQG